MKKTLTFLIIFAISIGNLFANGVKVDELYYDLNQKTKTAAVTYKNHIQPNPYIGLVGGYNQKWDVTIVDIPESITHKDITYTVVSIGKRAFADSQIEAVTIPNSIQIIEDGAFANCIRLKNIIIPNSVKSIESDVFRGCTNLTNVEIPIGLTKIGSYAFCECSNLKRIVIPNTVEQIGGNAFNKCEKITIYNASECPIPNITYFHIHLILPEQLLYYYPFTVFAKNYIERNINEWQKKGEFERAADWQKRVTEQTRQAKIDELLVEAQDKYINFHAKDMKISLKLGKYDAENEVFAMTDEQNGTLYLSVPIEEAQNFKNNWDEKKLIPQVQIFNDEIALSALIIAMPDGKQYTYRNTDAVNYNLAEMEYNFEPVELNLPKTSVPQQGQTNITTTKIRVGKSQVDTNIPETNTSNPNTFVVIFANEDYKNVASVPFAKNDGAVFQKYCQKTLGIPVTNIHYVENASYNDIRIQLAWLKDVCDAFEGMVSMIVYYAGHGIPDEASKSSYLLPIDGDGRYVQSAYSLDEFYNKLGAMNAQSVTVFMDACFSGSKREEGMLASARGVALKANPGQPQGNMVVFSAASNDETAYPDNDEQHGLFTYYLLKKLQETKGNVTLQALSDYISTNVRQQSIVKNGKPQTPCVTPSAAVADTWQSWKLK